MEVPSGTGTLELQSIFSHLVLRCETAVWDVRRHVGVVHGAEGQAVLPAAAEVCDLNILFKHILI